MRRAGVIALLAAFLAADPLWGEEAATLTDDAAALARWAALSGSIRTGYWSASRSLDGRRNLATAALWLSARPRLGAAAAIGVDGWVMSEQLFRASETAGRLREAYLDLTLGPVDIRAGQQIIAWGRADRINPTDNLTPRDFTLLVVDDADRRSGTPAVRTTVYRETLSFTAVWLPGFTPDTVPIRVPEPTATLAEQRPGGLLGQWAVKLDHTGKSLDWSVSYFDGFDLTPNLGIGSIDASGVELLQRHPRIQVIGADAAVAVGRYGLRAEAAYTHTEDARGTDPDIANPFLFLVVGGERTVLDRLSVNVQYLLRVVFSYHSPFRIPDGLVRQVAIESATLSNQLDPVQHGAALRLGHSWLHQRLQAELAAVVFFTRFNYAIRAKLTYAFTDRLRGTVGADLFRGPSPSFFGYLRDASGVHTELRWSF